MNCTGGQARRMRMGIAKALLRYSGTEIAHGYQGQHFEKFTSFGLHQSQGWRSNTVTKYNSTENWAFVYFSHILFLDMNHFA
ncbi:MAG: hypothetical protein SPG93_08780 [Prevotella sp.]|nr:hypothetical protein [Bacteroidales bacterium]MDY4952588.1 hypothetical protein [Prevotella sp.]MDY5321741.1 hypothetical protein [Prevotella sp.]